MKKSSVFSVSQRPLKKISLLFMLLGCIAGCSDPLPANNVSKQAGSGLAEPQAASFTEGVHYHLISESFPTKGPELRAFFSYGCPHCYLMHPVLKTLDTKHGIPVRMHHVPMLKVFPQAMQQSWSAGLFFAKTIGVEDAYHDALFDAIHVQKKQVTKDFIVDFFAAAQDGAGKESHTLSADPAALHAENELSRELLEHGDIKGVPSLIVNGRYRIDTSALSNSELSADIAALYFYLQSKGD